MRNPNPDKYAPLPDFFEERGRKWFKTRWTGAEISARHLPSPRVKLLVKKAAKEAEQRARREGRAHAERAKLAAAGVRSGEPVIRRRSADEEGSRDWFAETACGAGLTPAQVEDIQPPGYLAEYLARQRHDEIMAWLVHLFSNHPITKLLNADGRIIDLPSFKWRSDGFEFDIPTGRASWIEAVDGHQIVYSGRVLIDTAALDRLHDAPAEDAQADPPEAEPPAPRDQPSPADVEAQPETADDEESDSEEAGGVDQEPQPILEALPPEDTEISSEDRREARKQETANKYKRWYEFAQEIRIEGKWTRPSDIARAIEKKEVDVKGASDRNIRRRLDENYPGWAN